MEKKNNGKQVSEALYNINTSDIKKATNELMNVLLEGVKNASGADRSKELGSNTSLQQMAAALTVLGVEPNRNQMIAASVLLQNFKNAGQEQTSQINQVGSVNPDQIAEATRQKSDNISKFNDQFVTVKSDDKILKSVQEDVAVFASKLDNHKKLSEAIEEQVQKQPQSIKSSMLGVGQNKEAEQGISH
jgi:hypothetical protein